MNKQSGLALEYMMVRFDRRIEAVCELPRRRFAELAGIIAGVEARTPEREDAMIELALLGTERALRLLRWVDVSGGPRRMSWLKRMCVGECERRLGASERWRAA